MKLKEIGIWVGIIAILIGGMWVLITAVNNSPSPSTPAQIKIPEVSSQDFIRESASASQSAKVTLVEYSDFQCPACASAYPFVKKLGEDFPKDLRMVYRFFPLTNIHKNALISSQAAYAAGRQNKFWEMHDLLFENQSNWSETNPEDIFIGYAKELKLDLEKFIIDMNSNSTKEFVNKSANNAISIGINSTPSFFVNGRHISNPGSYEAFKTIIQDAMVK